MSIPAFPLCWHCRRPRQSSGGRLLELDRTATEDEIRQRYRSKAMEAHPDKGGSAAAMAELSEARDAALKERGGA